MEDLKERKVIIVDKNDQPIGLKSYYEIRSEDIYRVSALWITNSNGDILLAQRGLDELNDPGKWGPAVAGTIEEDETYESNIYKEAEEEIGLSGIKFTIGRKERKSGRHNYWLQWFKAVIDWPVEQFKVNYEDVEAIAWISSDEFMAELKRNPDKYLAGATDWPL